MPDFDIEKNYERLVKILERAKRGGSEAESRSAARLTADHLRKYPLPVRWFVPKGTRCRVVPAHHMQNLQQAAAIIREVELHKDRWFTERERVKGDGGDRSEDKLALESGFLYFTQHGFALFIPVQHVEVSI